MFQTKYNKDLGLIELGYYSVLQFVGELQDIIRVERPSPSDWLLFDARIQPKCESSNRIEGILIVQPFQPLL